ncbi:hypothetical protein F66182_1502 [Fusarium sp. NRRL 66182]|nr:hypothetical protein F66182_1502 [Fusarium sp. NRRL 66182]
MSETPSQSTTTPARRRNGRGNGRPAAQKAYASENDVATIDPARYDRAPRTPQKGAGANSPGPQMSHTNSKQRTRNGNGNNNNNNKPRGRNAPSSPESARPGRHTPPHQSSAFKAASSAFAGATFHASPAPSALPLPSFVSRPATESPSVSKTSRDIVQEPSPPTDTEAPTPLRQASSAVQESPLDFMFRAHRQEKERQRSESTSSFRPSGLANEPPSGAQSPFGPGTIPKPATLPARSQARFHSGGFDSAELDGTLGRPMGPAFSTPYQERIKAARSNSARSSAALSAHQSMTSPGQEDPAEALKKFLFNGDGTAASKSFPSGLAPAPAVQPYNHDRSGPGAPAPCESRPNNLQAMENDLRRILKLDLSTGSPSSNQRLFS